MSYIFGACSFFRRI